MSVLADLSAEFGAAFGALGLDANAGEVTVSRRPELAQFQCNGALGAAHGTVWSPLQVAQLVIEQINPALYSDLSIAPPGFINISLTDEALAGRTEVVRVSQGIGLEPTKDPQCVVVDYGGPNVAKALHIGHLRAAIIGESIKRTLVAIGHNVTGDVHLGDWGMPMGMLIAELADRRPELVYFDPQFSGPYPTAAPVTVSDFDEMYPAAASRAKRDSDFGARARLATTELQNGRPGYRALWEHFRRISVDDIREIYDELGVEFDMWHGESTIAHLIEPMVAKLVEAGIATESRGALIVEVASPNEKDEMAPLLLAKSDGSTLYTTWDVATVQDRVDQLGADAMIYVVDQRQALHFKQVFRAVRKAGIVGPSVVLEHANFGTVNGKDGKPLRTRDGHLPRLRDVINDAISRAQVRLAESEISAEYSDEEKRNIARMVGLAAMKYGDLQNHRASDYIFDLDRFVSFEGRTGPYLLYSAVRMASILEKADEVGIGPQTIVPPVDDFDRNLMLALLRAPDAVQRAADLRAPNHIALYAYELSATFSQFYEHCRILNETDQIRQASWLGLVELTRRVLGVMLDLLVLDVPQQM